MKNIKGIVATTPYYYFDNKANYVINFKLQVDRTLSITGEIFIELISPAMLKLKPGQTVSIHGDIKYNNGCRAYLTHHQISL